MSEPLDPALVEALSGLSATERLQVIALAERLKKRPNHEQRERLWDEIAGSLGIAEANEMTAAINEGCAQVNHEAW